MNPLLDEALACLARGWSVLPIHAGGGPRDKDPHSALLIRTGYHRWDEDAGRSRATWKPLQDSAPTEATVRVWCQDPTSAGIALVTGQVSGRIVIDFDGDEGRAYAHTLGVAPHVRTGGGYHWHVQAPAWRTRNVVGKSSRTAPDCVDVRGDGGNAVLPPTVGKKGAYRYLRDPAQADPLDAVPVTLREALGLVPPVVRAPVMIPGVLPTGDDRFPSARILEWALGRVQSGTQGGRNDVGYTLAWALYNNGYTHDEVMRVGEAYVAQVGQVDASGRRAPYTLEEFRASMRTAHTAPRGEPWGQRRQAEQAQGPSTTPAPTAARALEDVWTVLAPEEQARGAELLAHEWAAAGRPLEDTVRYLRLVGYAQAAQTARRAYRAREAGEALPGSLNAFLSARRVRFGRRA
jgi:hypothetical protein